MSVVGLDKREHAQPVVACERTEKGVTMTGRFRAEELELTFHRAASATIVAAMAIRLLYRKEPRPRR